MRDYSPPSTDLKLYKARIYSCGKDGDDRVQVRVLPYMADYETSECGDLPRYPALFKGQVITGYSELEPNPKTNMADEVFIVATSDWTVGYVLGLANKFHDCSATPYPESYGFLNVQNYLSTRGLDAIDYEDIYVDMWNNTKDGGFLIMHNFKKGDVYIINASGTCFVMQADKIYLRVGSPNGTSEGGNNNAFSTATITNTAISFKTKLFDVDAENVVLGHHGLKLLATLADAAVTQTYNGMNLMPLENIRG